MKQRRLAIHDMVRFEWQDACGGGHWSDPDGIDGELNDITTVGQVIVNNVRALTVTQSIDHSAGRTDQHITVPWAGIVNLRVLA